MKASSMYGSKHLSAADLQTSAVRARIVGVGERVFESDSGASDSKLVIDLDHGLKPMVLNATNAGALIDALGDETDDWLGTEITVAKETVSYRGKRVPGIRIREVHCKAQTDGPEPPPP